MQGMRQLIPPTESEPDLLALYGGGQSYVRAGFVISSDGVAVVDGSSRALSGAADRLVFRTLRAVCDVILVGAGTTHVEDYGTIRLTNEGAAWRQAQDLPPLPRVAVVSRSLDIDARVLGGPRPFVITYGAAAPPDLHADVILAGDQEVDIAAALDQLAAQGLTRVLCEGGPRLLGSVVAAGRLTELCLTTGALLAGAGPGMLPTALDPPVRLHLEHLLEEDGALLGRYTTVPI
ncbi:MAG: pyrimidine reductase family protein [Mycobacteriales bacterium]